MNNDNSELFNVVSELLTYLYKSHDIVLPDNDYKSITNASRWLVYSLMDTIKVNEIECLAVVFDQSTVIYDSTERTLEFNIVLVDDIHIQCGIQLMHENNEELPEQTDAKVREFFKEHDIRGVYVYFKTNMRRNGEDVEIEQSISSQKEILHPYILNKLSNKPHYLN